MILEQALDAVIGVSAEILFLFRMCGIAIIVLVLSGIAGIAILALHISTKRTTTSSTPISSLQIRDAA